MTTPKQKISTQPEYWTVSYVTSNNERKTEHGFATLNTAMRRLKTIQIQCHPSTIQQVEFSQIFQLDEVDQVSQDEIDYLDDRFLQAMEDNAK